MDTKSDLWHVAVSTVGGKNLAVEVVKEMVFEKKKKKKWIGALHLFAAFTDTLQTNAQIQGSRFTLY